MSTHVINPEHVLLAIVLKKAKVPTQFEAVSNGFHTYPCSSRKPIEPYCRPHRPLLIPILPCTTSQKLLDSVRFSYGAPEVKRVWGIGYRALMAENKARFINYGAQPC